MILCQNPSQGYPEKQQFLSIICKVFYNTKSYTTWGYNMKRKLNIEIEDEIFQKIHILCKGDDNAIKEYIIQAIKHHVSQSDPSGLSENNESLEDYLNKGRSGSRNYGAKGQGW